MGIQYCGNGQTEDENSHRGHIPPTPISLSKASGGHSANLLGEGALHFSIFSVIIIHFIILAHFECGPSNLHEVFRDGFTLTMIYLILSIAALAHFVLGIMSLIGTRMAVLPINVLRYVIIAGLCAWVAVMVIESFQDSLAGWMCYFIIILYVPVAIIYVVLSYFAVKLRSKTV